MIKLEQHAATSLGKQRSMALLPVTDVEHVKHALQLTNEAVNVIRLKGNAPFGGIRNIRDSVQRARIAGLLQASDLLDIAGTIHGGRTLKAFLSVMHKEHPVPGLELWFEQLSDHRTVEQAIRRCIDDNGDVLDQASSALATIRRDIRTGEARIRERLEQMLRSSSTQKMLQDILITIRNGRYVIPVKQEYRSQIGGMIHDQSASGATLFIEPEAIVNMNNRLRELALKEEREIEVILRELTERVADIADDLLVSVEALAELDFIFAKANLAYELKASLPIMNDRGFIKLKRARHPLIPSDSVVPINVELGNNYRTIIVTGPNTGGKTVTLKTIGLLNLMAMSGLFIPADDGSQLCVFDAIYADIGDEQSIEQSLSTFSSHLTNIIRILRGMTPKSLVLLDELGAGTDPAEGSALAIALLEYIHKMGCRLIATTHFSELKAYAYERQGVINASMEFDVQTLSPTYRLMVGVPGRSNALAIAERLGLPASIIEAARSYVGESDQQVDTMIASLEANRITAEAERASAEQQRREVEQLKEQLEQERRKFAEQKEKLLLKAEQEAREAVKKAKLEAEQVIAELRAMAMEEQASIKEHKLIEAKRRIDEAMGELSERKRPRPTSRTKAEYLEIGDEVRVLSLGQKGHIVEWAGQDAAVVQLGILKMKVERTDMERLAPAKKTVQAGPKVKRTRDEHVRTELDLRGAALDDALIEADRFIDEAFLANLGQVYIIHGKGTGVLRNGIQEFLRTRKHIKAYRLGNYGEGGDGVTVVELR